MAVYAIGDIQGCFDEFQQLLKKINFKPDSDTLWLCGDVVNRGPRSLETLEYIHAIRDNVHVVLGNHDLHLLATYYHHRHAGRKDTLDAILHARHSETLLDWLRQQPLLHSDTELDVHMVHAGVHPDWSIDKARSLAKEVEKVLQSDKHVMFYKHMYGDKPRHWSDQLKGWPRLRFITNILTRVRYFKADKRASLNQKGAPGTQPQDQVPWFDMDDRASRKDRILFGHWSTLALVERDYENVYPLDDGCLWGGRLHAMRIDTEPFVSKRIKCLQQQKPQLAKQD